MGYHHLGLAARDMAAIHHFYEDVMGFELVKVEIAPVPDGGWAKHFFYRMDGDDSRFIAFWELHDVPGTADLETNVCRAAGGARLHQPHRLRGADSEGRSLVLGNQNHSAGP
jgi:catechol 2,3-dioxygenase-like lactoylglutathione lyase family enzyme